MTRNEVAKKHMRLKEGVRYWPRAIKEDFRAKHMDSTFMCNGYWAVVSERLARVFAEIEWLGFCGLEEMDIETRVRALGKAKLECAWEEAKRKETATVKSGEKGTDKKNKKGAHK
jgi:hypothetical protein